MCKTTVRCAAIVALMAVMLLGPGASGDKAPSGAQSPAAGNAASPEPVLTLRNRTPFMVSVYIAGVRSGWIKPFRTESFRGLKPGRHKVFVATHYGSASWGPKKVEVPGLWNLTPPKDVKVAAEVEEAIASRLYRRARNSLVACQRLAERRGERLPPRVTFQIDVDADGKAKAATVTGDKLSPRLHRCYGAMARTWSVPSTGSSYTVKFDHMP